MPLVLAAVERVSIGTVVISILVRMCMRSAVSAVGPVREGLVNSGALLVWLVSEDAVDRLEGVPVNGVGGESRPSS